MTNRDFSSDVTLDLSQVGEEHRMMGGVIGQSRRLITKYGRREFTDKVFIKNIDFI